MVDRAHRVDQRSGAVGRTGLDRGFRVASFEELADRAQQLTAGDWLALRRQPRSHRVRETGGRRTHIVRFFTADQWDTCHQRLFRDWLRSHPDDRARYQAVKLAASPGTPTDYALSKQPLVLDIVNRARAARGLQPIDDLDPAA